MVRATFAGFSTALSALQANQKRLDIVGQNLANMNTVGYTRQQLETSSFNYTNPVSHYMNGSHIQVGYGVSMDRVSQIRDPYLDVQYRDQIVKASYNDSLQTSLESLASVLDESNLSGIRQAFDDIQSTLTNMQDPAKINSAVYESELQARMKTLANLLNDAVREIEKAETEEYQRLDGEGTSENGAVQEINDILKQIGDLNIQIKRNQVHGQPSLELMDERNVLLDELASYIPIEVTYYDDPDHPEWPDDLKVDLIYKGSDGISQTLTLIDGVKGGEGMNYGSVTCNGSADDPTNVSLTFTEAQCYAEDTTYLDSADFYANVNSDEYGNYFASGSVQASLDMLGKNGDGLKITTDANGAEIQEASPTDTVRGYQYYMEQLNTLAKTFADTMNVINNNAEGTADDNNLLSYDEDNPAKTLTLDEDWVSGAVHVSKAGENATDTILEMLKAMSDTYDVLDNNSFADFMNHTSTILANDTMANKVLLETNTTILNGIQDSRDSISAVSLDEEAANMMAFSSAYNAASRLMTALDEALNTLINNTGLVGR